MPAGDGTGPMGTGPRTGWGMGYCGGYDAPGWANWGPGRRFSGRGGRWGGHRAPPAYVGGRPGGGGWGWRHWYHATGLPRWARWGAPPAGAYGPDYGPPSREQEIGMLKDEAEWLKDQLDAINQRMDELSQG
jgi:hypothetical protein